VRSARGWPEVKPSPALLALWRELGLPADYLAAHALPLHAEADEATLISIGSNAEGRPIRLIPPAARAWCHMHAAAAADGITLLPLSGFRSVARQAELIRAKLAAGRPIAEILHLVAAPGCSEHHTGGALDVGAPENTTRDETFAHTPAFRWLTRHAAAHSFTLSYPQNNPHGIAYEPWHWCWHPAPRPPAARVEM
jgi:D-alanyl-D-alanine carboxypeptidase